MIDLRHGRLVAERELAGRVVAALDITPDGEVPSLDSRGELSLLDITRPVAR